MARAKHAGGYEAMSLGTHAYVGRKPGCGCAVAMCVDVPDVRKGTAKLVSRFIIEGLEVARVTVEDARAIAYRQCPHDRQGAFDLPELEGEDA